MDNVDLDLGHLDLDPDSKPKALTGLGACAVCSVPCDTKCGRCCNKDHPTYYCSKEHQQGHWKVHKLDCKGGRGAGAPAPASPGPPAQAPSVEDKVQVVVGSGPGDSDFSGKVLQATVDIKAGEIIYKEKPLVYGPRFDQTREDEFPLCLECGKLLPEVGAYECTKCDQQLCGPECENGPMHSGNECSIFAASGVHQISNVYHYLGLLILRAVLLKAKDREAYEKILELDLAPEAYLGEEFSVLFHETVGSLNLKIGKDGDFGHFKHMALALLKNRIMDEPNNLDTGTNTIMHSYLYHKTSFLAHSCIPNSERYIQSNGDIIVRATVPIKKGTLVTCSKTELYYPTNLRRLKLKESFGIDCDCERCLDPTELGTMLSGIKCKASNCSDYYLPPIKLSRQECCDPADEIWRCNSFPSCTSQITKLDVIEVESKITDEFQIIRNQYEMILDTDYPGHIRLMKEEEKLVRKYEGRILHPNHYINYVLRKKLVTFKFPVYGKSIEKEADRMEFKKKQVSWARECLSVADKISPGYTSQRGHLLYSLQQGLLISLISETSKLGNIIRHSNSHRIGTYVQNRLAKIHDEEYTEIIKFRNETKIILGIEREGKFESIALVNMEAEEVEMEKIDQIILVSKVLAKAKEGRGDGQSQGFGRRNRKKSKETVYVTT